MKILKVVVQTDAGKTQTVEINKLKSTNEKFANSFSNAVTDTVKHIDSLVR